MALPKSDAVVHGLGAVGVRKLCATEDGYGDALPK